MPKTKKLTLKEMVAHQNIITLALMDVLKVTPQQLDDAIKRMVETASPVDNEFKDTFDGANAVQV